MTEQHWRRNAEEARQLTAAMPDVIPDLFLCLCLPAGQDEFKLAGEELPTRTSTPSVPSVERLGEIRGLMTANALRFKSEFLPPRT